MSELGPVSEAILDYVNSKPGYIQNFRMIHAVHLKTGAKHTAKWYFRQLVALALKGYIEATVTGTDETLSIRFRRLQEDE